MLARFPLPTCPLPLLRLGFSAVAVVLLWVATLPAQVTPEQAAELLLNSARKAYNEKNYPFAATRFQEFLGKYGSHKEVPAARYGLALSLLELPQKDYNGAIAQLQPLAGNKDLPEHPFVLYYLGVAQRGLGIQGWPGSRPGPRKPPSPAQANQRFDEAAKQFAAATMPSPPRPRTPIPRSRI